MEKNEKKLSGSLTRLTVKEAQNVKGGATIKERKHKQAQEQRSKYTPSR